MRPKRVLIADDDQGLVSALALRCAHLGLEVRTANDGAEAVALVEQEPPDLAILDVNMPAGNGLAVCEMLANDQRMLPIPVIILTGRNDDRTVERCEQLGAHYVYKGADIWESLKPIVLELCDVEPVASLASVPVTARPTGGAARRPAPKLLVIDDDPDLSKALKIKLRPFGIEVLRAFNGMQGYWAALKHRPDVIITDYYMPDGRGNYLIGRLSNHTLTRHTPCIVITGRTVEGHKDYAMERELRNMGARALLTKPLDFAALLETLREFVDIPHRPRAPRLAAGV
ncbi:MAG: response regulator [Planctomycetes bacterium]|nr:response regulator [Planctomycetota bacterium]